MEEFAGKVEKIASSIHRTVELTVVELGKDNEYAKDYKEKFKMIMNKLAACEQEKEEIIKCLDIAKKHKNASDFEKEFRGAYRNISIDMSQVAQSKRVKEFEIFIENAYKGDLAAGTSTEGMTVTETVQRTDPFTKRALVNPVRNVTCKHVYDKDSLAKIITLNPNVRCPYVGCTNKSRLRMVDVIEDPRLRHNLQIEDEGEDSE